MADEIENQMTEGPEPDPVHPDPPHSEAVHADPRASDAVHADVMQADAAHSATAYPDAKEPDPTPEDSVTTGHTEIDTALRRLEELDALPVERHGDVYDELHGRLRDALTAAATPTSESSDA